jgi:hypothetical protein
MSFFTDDDIVKLDEDEATREAQENIPTQVAQELKQEQQDLADPRSPAQQAVEGVSSFLISNQPPALLADVVMGLSKGRTGAQQGVSQAADKASELFNWFIGEEYDAEEAAQIRQEEITNPEITRQKVYAKLRQDITGDKPSSLALIVGEALPTGAFGPSAGVGVLKSLLQSASAGGISGYMEFTEGGEKERATNTLFGSAVSATMDALFRAVEPVVKIGVALGKSNLRDLAKTEQIDLKQTLSKPEVDKVTKAAEELGIVVTPAEATGDQLLIFGQEQLNLTTATREQIADFINKRNDALTEGMLSLQRIADRDIGIGGRLDGATFTPTVGGSTRAPFVLNSDEKAFKQTRQQVFKQTLDSKDFNELISASPSLRKIINDYQAALKAKPDKRTANQAVALDAINDLKKELGLPAGFPIENVGFMDMMLKRFDKLLPSGVGKTGAAKADERLIAKQRDAVSQRLKEKVPGYGDLKAREQRALAVKTLQDAIDSSATQGVNIENFYNTLLKDKKARLDLLRKLSTDKGAQKKVNDLATVLSHILSDANLAKKIRDVDPDSTLSATVFSRIKGHFANDKGVINLITNPQWQYDISKIKGRTPEATLRALSNYLGRVVSVSDAAEETIGFKEAEQQGQQQ